MNADLSVDKIEINPSEVAATMSATQDRIRIAPVKKPKPQPKPKPQQMSDWDKTLDWDVSDMTVGVNDSAVSSFPYTLSSVINIKR